MLNERTNWPLLYGTAVLLGAGFGLLASLRVLPLAPAGTAVVLIVGGALVGLILAAAAHIGVRLQLRRRSFRRFDT
jgi:hypothetical protein